MGEKGLLKIPRREAPRTAPAFRLRKVLQLGRRGQRQEPEKLMLLFRRVFHLLTSLSFPEEITTRLS